MIYNKGGANHARMQRRIQADSMFRCQYSFVEKANLVAIVRARMTEDRVSFSQAVDSVGVPLSTLYKWQADLPLTPSTLQQDHQGPPSFIHDIEPQLLSFIYEWRDRGMPVSCISVIQKAIQLKFFMNQDADQPLSGEKHKDVSQWILDVVGAISEETVKNAWRKNEYSYFEG